MKFPITLRFIKPCDARGWIGVGCYVLVLIILCMMWTDKGLLKDDFFKLLATAIVLTGWNNGPVGWAYQATQSGGEAAKSSARIAEGAAAAAIGSLPPTAPPSESIKSPDAPAAAQAVADAAQGTADEIKDATTQGEKP